MARDDDLTSALRTVVRDHGRSVYRDPRRFRAALSDVLGARSDDLRGQVDALAICVEEDIPARIREARLDERPGLRADAVAGLSEWGLTPERAGWAVDVWMAQVPPTTEPAPVTDPDPAPDPGPPPPTELPAEDAPPIDVSPDDEIPPPDEVPSLDAVPPHDEDPPHDDEADAAEPDSSDARRPRRRRRRLAVGVLALVALAGAGALAVTTRGGGDAPTVPRLAADAVVAATKPITAPAPESTPAMGSTTGGVRLTSHAEVDDVTTADGTFAAPERQRLIGFSVADWPCDRGATCVPWQQLGLTVVVGDDVRTLPAGDGTFAVAVPDRAEAVDLVLTADGLTQRLSLLDGTPGPDNIVVLARDPRVVTVDRRFTLTETTSIPIDFADGRSTSTTRKVTIGDAELVWSIRGKNPGPGRAYLRVDATYTAPGYGPGRFTFTAKELRFTGSDGRPYPVTDVDPASDRSDPVIEVPGDLPGGTLVIGSTTKLTASDGTSYTSRLQPKKVPISFG